MSLIKCNNLMLSYDNRIVARNLNFEIDSGDYVCIVGENGSGKSTLIKTLLGLKSTHEGTIELCDGLKRNEIGYLPQQSAIQKDFPASVREVVLSGLISGCGFRPFYTAAQKEIAYKNMCRMGVEGLEDSCYRELSGGQQQRVLLARALCAAKRLLVLDEPVSGLDPVVTEEMYNIIKSINENEGMTVIMVSHDVKKAVVSCNRILHLGGSAFFYGNVCDYVVSDCGKRYLGGFDNV